MSGKRKFGEAEMVSFSEEEIMKCKDYMGGEECRGYTHVFSLMYLPCRKEWLRSYSRICQNLLVDGNEDFWMFRVTITNGETEYSCNGSGHSRSDASDVGCYKLSRVLREALPSFAMPQYLIGYPNLRGHCFIISALLPLLHSFPFICEVFDANASFEMRLNRREYRHNCSRREAFEVPCFWVNSVYKIYADYRKVAATGGLELNNGSVISYMRASEETKRRKKKPKVVRPDDDLKLDKTLVKGLVSILRTYCDEEYFRTPGGDERDVYKYLICKLGSEIEGFMEKFTFRVLVKYSCRFCAGGPYTEEFHLPIVHVAMTDNFQDILKDAALMVSRQVLDCVHKNKEYTCHGTARSVHSAKFLNVPQVICFGVETCTDEGGLRLPEELTYEYGGKTVVYGRLASSVCILEEESEAESDESSSSDSNEGGTGHTFVHIKTQRGFYEVDNGVVYEPGEKFGVTTPSSIHIYQLKAYMNYLPDMDRSQVSERGIEE